MMVYDILFFGNSIIKFALRIIFGIACYFIANKKDRNESLAFAMGFFFGIFALIYYLVVSAKGSISEKADYVRCKKCGEIFVSKTPFCPSCKNRLSFFNTKNIK